MKLIPVIDLQSGGVVHAREGDRAKYGPLRSTLCEGATPETVIDALLALHPFDTLYVADLDAIQRRGRNRDVVAAIRRRFPDLQLWVDSGIAQEDALNNWIGADLGSPVIGSESLTDAAFIARASTQSTVLSLDFRGTEFLGPAALLSEPQRWPHDVLAMNLARVGSVDGPDFALIRRLAALAPDRAIYCAGGVRSTADLQQAAQAGASGALLASALHDGRIGADDLKRFGA